MKAKFKSEDKLFDLNYIRNANNLQIQHDGQQIDLEVSELQFARYILSIDSKKIPVFSVREKDKIFVRIGHFNWTFKDKTHEDESGTSFGDGNLQVISPMPGSVIKVMVNVGDHVKKNQTLVVIEAMKMENEVRASMDAMVESILVKPSQQVSGGEELIKLVPVADHDISQRR